ncbi:MAG: phenylacetate--CoA ligase family protein [Bacillota bacterium]
MIWNRARECMERPQLEQLQLERLRNVLRNVYKNVPFYRNKFQEMDIEICDIHTIEDIKILPFTVKQDLRDNYPFDMFAVPMSEIVRIHASSGTTGKPSVVGYTQKDIATWSELMARTLMSAGAQRNMVVQVAFGYGLFTGGLGAHYGAERIGASVIPISGGNSKRQIMLMQDFGTAMICCTPSYALYLAETMAEMGVDPKELNLKYGVFGAEPWTNAMRREIEAKLDIRATDIYGLSEIMGPGVAYECEYQDGLHIAEDHFLPEIIDPDTLNVLPIGEKGELVITTITKEGIPLIRYRTRDITTLNPEPCACGRTHMRIGKVLGRSDDMLIIRGVNVFPSQIETLLVEFGDLEPHYQLIVDRVDNLDSLEIQVEVSESLFSDEIRRLEDLQAKISREIQSALGLSARVKLVEPKTIERSEGKAKRVIDKRVL